MSLRHMLASLLLAVASLTSAPAWAVSRCVGTTAELLDAMQDYSIPTPGDEVYSIKLRTGTYPLGNEVEPTSMYMSNAAIHGHHLRIIGGYNADCSARTMDPFATSIITPGPLYLDMNPHNHDVAIEGLTVDSSQDGNFQLRTVSIPGCSAPTGQRITLSHVAVRSAPGGPAGSLYLELGCTDLRIENSLLEGSISIIKQSDADAHSGIELINNTIVNSPMSGVFLHNYADDDEMHVALYNNVIWGHAFGLKEGDASADIRIGAYNNTWNTSTAEIDFGAFNNTLNPQLTPDFRLTEPGSPAINSGDASPPGGLSEFDILGEGHPRLRGSDVDRGAFESSIDNLDTWVVTTTADDGTGSLRWAIGQANAIATPSRIRFNIGGGCPRIIELGSPLPSITSTLTIDGYSQPGSEPATSSLNFNATICVGVRGDLSTNHALELPISVGASESLNVSGIGFGGFDVGAIRLAGGAGSWIHGNQFGGELEGVALGNSAVNVRIGGTSHDNLVGGEEPAQRNLIMFAYNAGIELLENSGGVEGHGNHVVNNFIGTDAGGTAMAANNLGVRVRTHQNVIKDNLISGNQTHGVLIEGALANENEVSSNRIGLKSFAICLPEPCDPDYALGNIEFGVLVDGGSGNWISFNEVAHNGSKGIRLFEGQRNRLLGNRVHDNASFGIDLGVEGINPDYGPGSDQLANHGINAPSISGARGSAHAGQLTGLVSARGATTYVMQAFSSAACDASGFGEGQTLVGTKVIEIGGSPGSGGTVEYEMPIESNGNLQSRFITTTWFDEDGNSSEFSNCVPYYCDTIFRHGFDSASAERCTAP